jgi:Do/DeqQ family serine protease
MKKIISIVCVSILTSALTIYTLNNKINNEQTNTSKPNYEFKTANYNVNNTSNSLPLNNDFVSAAEKTIDAVVHVKNTTNYSGPVTIQDLFFNRRTPQSQVGTGSGVIISPDGYIITNNHVIDRASDIEITLNNNKSYKAELIGTDKETDIALLKIDTEESLPYTTFGDSDEAKIGEWVLAVGNPFNLTSTVTAGIISAKSRDLSGEQNQSFIQTDAAVNPGNSGGALVNLNGDLIGINTAIFGNNSFIGYSFAVPSNIARKVVEDIMEFGDVKNGILGVRGTELNSVVSENIDINETEGFYVDSVEDGSGAQKAGLKHGDIIQKIDNIKITKFTDMKGYLKTKRPNDEVNIVILRDNKQKQVKVTLSTPEIFTIEFMDMKLKNISNSVKSKLQIKNGVLIERINNKSLKNTGITQGYFILSINDRDIESIDDINALKQSYNTSVYSIKFMSPNGEIERIIFR